MTAAGCNRGKVAKTAGVGQVEIIYIEPEWLAGRFAGTVRRPVGPGAGYRNSHNTVFWRLLNCCQVLVPRLSAWEPRISGDCVEFK